MEKQNFKDIWLSSIALFTRKGLIKADRNFSPCDVCDVSGDLIENMPTNGKNILTVKMSNSNKNRILILEEVQILE